MCFVARKYYMKKFFKVKKFFKKNFQKNFDKINKIHILLNVRPQRTDFYLLFLFSATSHREITTITRGFSFDKKIFLYIILLL